MHTYLNLVLAIVCAAVGFATLVAPQWYWKHVVARLYQNPQAIEPNKNGMRMWRISGLFLLAYGLSAFAGFFF